MGAALLPTPSLATAAEAPAVVLAVVIDTSGSLGRQDLDAARELTVEVLAALPASSQAAVFSFDDQAQLVLERTSDAAAVKAAVDGLAKAGSHTALNDALYDASRYLRDAPGRRRAILLVTDGRDERSAVVLEDGLTVAQQTRIPVYCVGVGRVEERVLRRIAKLTEGQYHPGVVASAAEIAREILESPEAPASSSSPIAPAPATPLATLAAASADPLPAPPRTSIPPVVWAAVGFVLLAVAGSLLLLATRSRPAASAARLSRGPRPDPQPDDSSPLTMIAPLDVSQEDLQKTMLLQEKPVLVVTGGARLGQIFTLSRGSTISLGRARANDVVLDDVAVSSQHCRIRPEGDRFVLQDLESTNGTRVNDRRVKKHVLAEGDVIQIGETRLEFRMDTRPTERI
jgi:FHA domain/von Willebrand factor type A domain